MGQDNQKLTYSNIKAFANQYTGLFAKPVKISQLGPPKVHEQQQQEFEYMWHRDIDMACGSVQKN